MKLLYSKSFVFTFCLVCAACFVARSQSSTAYFDLDACNAKIITGDNMNYSEFTAQIDNSACADLSVIGGYLYRLNPAVNKHSCTPGVGGAPAMCISSNPLCSFTPGSDQALRIDLLVTPGSSGSGTLSELTFYEQGPTVFNWINGDSGPNNYPTLFSVRILKNGVEIFLAIDLPTALTWNLNTFNFSGMPEFTVSEPTTFNIQLLPYCPIGNGAPVSAWDIDEIVITANCCEAPAGGELTGGPFEFCSGDNIPDNVSGVVLSGQSGPNSQWVVTNAANIIVSLPLSPESVDFDNLGPGTFLIWHLSFEDGLTGLVVGNNLLSGLNGCFGISNSVTVINNQPEGGSLTGGPFEFCVGDSIPDHVTGVVLTGNSGPNSQWVVTNDVNTILSLPASLDLVDFDGGGPGICLIWNITYFDPVSGLIPGNNLLTDITGCFDLSNSITVIRNQPEGGELSGGPFEFCGGDSIPDHISGLVLSGNTGDSTQYVITDEAGNILALTDSPEEFDFDSLGQGTFLIWHVSFFSALSGLEIGNNLFTDLTGCFDLSNSVTVISTQPEGGELTGGPFEFCVGDSIPDHVNGILLSGNTGNAQWVVTNDAHIILSLPDSIHLVDFDGGGPGICLIWNISYFDTLSGLVPGNNLLTDVTGCFDLSNPITVVRNQAEGGTLTGGPFEFCVGDSIPDHVSGIALSGNMGSNGQWVVTNDSLVILSLPNSPEEVDFDGGGPGICLIWHVSFFDTLSGLEPGNDLLVDLSGCFAISNPIPVIRHQPEGGELTGGPFEFCVGDSVQLSGILLSGNTGPNSQWIVTDDGNIILGLPNSPEDFDFSGSGLLLFNIWNISFFDTLSGLVVGSDLLEVSGCSDLSNPIEVSFNQPEGGELEGGPFEFCVGDSIPDHVSGIVLSGNIGSSGQWVVTNDVNVILSLPNNPEEVDFDGGGQGVCLIWHVSYFGTLTGLEPGNDLLNDLSGCFALSNSVTVVRNQPDGGELTGGPFEFCVGDSIPDQITGIVLTGNSGPNSQWVVTDAGNIILSLPDAPEDFDFEGSGLDAIFIWNISFFDTISGLLVGNDLFEVTGCFGLSNPIEASINQPEGGELTGGPFEFCVDDGIPDHVSGIMLSGNNGSSGQWVVTDDANMILSLPSDIEAVDFDGGGQGICLIWHVSYFSTISGLEVGNDLLTDLEGCFAISNSVTVIRNEPEGGELSGGPFEFCVGDSISDLLSGVELINHAGESFQWIVTNGMNIILNLPDSLEELDFDDDGPGMILIWNISFFGTLDGLDLEGDLSDLAGCFDLSNPITVILNQPDGGELTGGPFEFCVGDSIPDHVSGIELLGNIGDSSQYVITDEFNVILSLPDSPEDVDFDMAPPGICLIWHVSYYDTLSGLEPGNNLLTDVEGCFSLSNSIAVVREDCSGLQGDPVFKMQVFPNPVTDKLTLRMLHSGDETLLVELFDASGRLCFKQNHQTSTDMPIDMGRFAEGCYFIRVQSPLGHKTERVLVVR